MFSAIILSSFLMAAAFGAPTSAPAGPNFDTIQYLHNLNLTYSNNTLEGLGAIDSYSDVDSQMADSLKAAINRALPGYLNVPTSTASTASGSSSPSSTTPSTSQGSTTPMIRQKRDATGSSTTALPSDVATTTQPYGTDEEFYARTDLVHFHVNIDQLEGSGV